MFSLLHPLCTSLISVLGLEFIHIYCSVVLCLSVVFLLTVALKVVVWAIFQPVLKLILAARLYLCPSLSVWREKTINHLTELFLLSVGAPAVCSKHKVFTVTSFLKRFLLQCRRPGSSTLMLGLFC